MKIILINNRRFFSVKNIDLEEGALKKPITSRETILATCRDLLASRGLESISMRGVARACGVALGSIYYYFPSKNDLVLATIESVWQDLFRMDQLGAGSSDFKLYIELCFSHLKTGIKKYPNFFTIHSLSFSSKEKNRAKAYMEQYRGHIKESMKDVLHADNRVSEKAFSEDFTEDDFLEFILNSLLSLLLDKSEDCAVLLEIIERVIY